MNFINYDNLLFSNLDNKETVLITAEKDTYVESISICNKNDKSNFILMSLRHVKSLNVPNPINTYRIRNLIIDKNTTKDLIQYLGRNIFLNNGDSLIVSSAGYTEIFDCVIDFYELNEIVNG